MSDVLCEWKIISEFLEPYFGLRQQVLYTYLWNGTHINDCGHLVKHLSVKITLCCVKGTLAVSMDIFHLDPPAPGPGECIWCGHCTMLVDPCTAWLLCILISHESQSCCFLTSSLCCHHPIASSTVLAQNRALSNMLQAYLKKEKKKMQE